MSGLIHWIFHRRSFRWEIQKWLARVWVVVREIDESRILRKQLNRLLKKEHWTGLHGITGQDQRMFFDDGSVRRLLKKERRWQGGPSS